MHFMCNSKRVYVLHDVICLLYCGNKKIALFNNYEINQYMSLNNKILLHLCSRYLIIVLSEVNIIKTFLKQFVSYFVTIVSRHLLANIPKWNYNVHSLYIHYWKILLKVVLI